MDQYNTLIAKSHLFWIYIDYMLIAIKSSNQKLLVGQVECYFGLCFHVYIHAEDIRMSRTVQKA